jgi:FdhD protein
MQTAQVKMIYYCHRAHDRRYETRQLIEEEPLTIDILGGGRFTLMRTPGQDENLIVGFLFSEGIINGVDEILTMTRCPDRADLYRVRIADEKRRGVRRNLVVNSSCGLCGRTDVDALVNDLGVIENGIEIPIDVLYRLPGLFKRDQRLFDETGGSHAAAIFDRRGEIEVLHEDLGRHNALDKVIGHGLLHGLAMGERGVFLSGRISLEMIVKAARARFALLAAISAASARAVATAQRLGLTVCGFVRGDEIAVYSHDWRIHP